MKIKSSLQILMLMVLALVFCQCASRSEVTHATHRATPSGEISGVVTSSYPVKYTKRSGIGAVVGSVGGAILGSRIGSGRASSFAGSVGGSLIGGIGGNAAEGAARSRSAREITVRAEEKTFRTITSNNPPLEKGDSVLILTNVYGQILRVVPSN